MTTFKVQKREMDKKAKQVRREGFVTANLFGKDIDGSIPLVIERKEAEKIQRECLKGSQLYLELDGKKYDVLLKELDYDSMKNQILEMDFQSLVKGEKVHTVAEIVLQHRDKVAVGLVEQLLAEISYKAVPEAIIDKIDVDCSKLRLGDTLTVADLDIAKDKDIEIVTHMDTPVVSVIAPKGNVPEEETAEEKE